MKLKIITLNKLKLRKTNITCFLSYVKSNFRYACIRAYVCACEYTWEMEMGRKIKT